MSERDRVWAELGFGDEDEPQQAAAPPEDALADELPPEDSAPEDRAPEDRAPEEPPDETLELRRTPAERVLDRVGRRGFARPRVAVSSRIFARYRVSDPWDPDPKEPEDPIALGPVSLALGERREVAPHLRPPERAKPASRTPAAREPAAWRPRPAAPAERSDEPGERPPSPPPQASPPPRPAAPATRSDVAAEFGARDQRQPLRAPLPVRPDLAGPGSTPPAAGAAAPRPPAAASGRVSTPPAATAAPRPAPATTGPATTGPATTGPATTGPATTGPAAGSGGGVDPASLPRPPLPRQERATGGRFRLSSTEASGPVVKEVRRLDEVTAEEAAARPPEPAPEPPRARLPPMGDSLDDLFGMAAMGGRMSLGSSRKKAPADDEGPEPEED